MKCPKCGRAKPDLAECFKKYGTCYLLEQLSEEDEEIIYLHEEKFRIIDALRKGGMATLYLGEEHDGRLCIIKEMYDYFPSPEEKRISASMFEAEAFMLLSLNHPGIPEIMDFFIEDDKYYLVMEYIEGENLSDLLYNYYQEGFPEKDILSYGIQICDILECLHSYIPPVIHRDINPNNFIKRDSDGKITMIDFGIATIFEPEGTVTLTGTPGYIAPELYESYVDVRSDIFSLGVTLHQLLTGQDPSEGIPFEFEPVRKFKPSLSHEIEKIIEKSLEKDREKRFNSVIDMKQEFLKIY